METIAWIGFAQGIFSAILMLTKRNQSTSDKILTAWLFLLSIEFLTCAIDIELSGIPHLSSSFLLLNPAFFLYSGSLVIEKFKLKPVQLLHLFPFIFFDILAYVMKEPSEIRTFLVHNENLWFRSAFSIASVVSWICYNWLTVNILLRHRKRLVNEFSTIESNKKVSWLLFVIISYNTYCLAYIAIAVSVILTGMEFPLTSVYNYSALLLMTYILGFYGLRQEVIYAEAPLDVEDRKETYGYSFLSEKRKSEIKVQLIDYFSKEKPYLNPELSMKMLSDELKIPKHQLTEVLNSVIGKNFFQFVNEYRVEAVKKMLLSNKGYSIEDIGYECGFNSKSAFFTVFRKVTGLTPMNYRQNRMNIQD